MTTLKDLTTIAALLAGGMSLALAQNGPPTGGYPPIGGGAQGNPAPTTSGPPGPGVIPHDAPRPGAGAAAQSTAPTAAPSPYLRSAAPTGASSGPRVVHRTTKHISPSGTRVVQHSRMYMHSGNTAANASASGGSGTHKGALKTGSAANNQKVLKNQSGYR